MIRRIDGKLFRVAPIFRRYVLDRFDDLESFMDFSLSSISKERKSIQARFDKETQSLSKRQKDEYFDWYGEDLAKVDELFAKVTMYSLVITLFSYVESGLNTISRAEFADKENFEKENGQTPANTLQPYEEGGGIEGAKAFLEKTVGLELHPGEQPWSEIQSLRKIRNVIVHFDGKAVDEIVKDGNVGQHIKNGRLEISGDSPMVFGKLIIKPGYLEYILPFIRRFFQDIGNK